MKRAALIASLALAGCGDIEIGPVDAASPPPRPDGGVDLGAELVLEPLGDVNARTLQQQLSARLVEHGGEVYFGAHGPDGISLLATDGTPAGTRVVAHRSGWTILPEPRTAYDGALVFTVDDELVGEELWRSDGSDAGTQLLVDAAPGVADGFDGVAGVVGGALYFTARTPAGVRRLWRSEGTPETSAPVSDAVVAQPPMDHATAVVLGARVVFAATSLEEGTELWISDGTPAGTQLALDIQPGAASSSPRALTELGGKVFFYADDGVSGVEPWVTDGTAAGTRRLLDVCAGPAGSQQPFLPGVHARGSVAYFQADDCVHGVELWRTDGTTAGTRLVRDLEPGAGSSSPSRFATLGDEVVFVATTVALGAELHVTDGTSAGTRALADIRPGPSGCSPTAPVSLGASVLFTADDGVHGRELFRTDGTAEGTRLLFDLLPGPDGGVSTPPRAAGGRAYFTGSNGETGPLLLSSDGTVLGTRMFRELTREGTEPSRPRSFVSVGARVLFSANDGQHGEELWVYDEGAEPRLLADVSPGAASGVGTMLGLGDRAIFVGTDPEHGAEPWVTDGTEEGTRLLEELTPGPTSSQLSLGVVLGDRVYFTALEGGLRSLRSTDGRSASTLHAISPSADGALVGAHGGKVVLSWTDGEGTGLFTFTPGASLARIAPVNLAVRPPSVAAIDGALYFTTYVPIGLTPGGPAGLYRSDGTLAGAVRVSRFGPGSVFSFQRSIGFVSNAEVYRLDGMEATRVARVGPPWGEGVAELGGAIYFLGGNGTLGSGLWRMGSLAGGAELVRGLGLGASGARPVVLWDRLVFLAADAATGTELWSSDGTEGGTQRIADARPGPASSAESGFALTPLGDVIYLVLDDGVHGAEPWRLRMR